MSCRIQSIKPPCAYVVEGIEKIMVLDFEDFRGYRFLDGGTYESCYVTDILQVDGFRDIAAPDLVAKYSYTGNVHRLETFIDALNYDTIANLHLATKRPQIVLFKTNSQQWFTFGYEAGAKITYTNQTSDGLGSQVVAVANSIYPLFEYNGEIIDTPGGGGELMIQGAYASDADAGADGVELDELYELTADNIYGMPEGVIKRRKL